MLATSTVLVLFCFFLQSAHLAALAASHGDPSLLDLNEGLNLSVSASFNASTGSPISQDLMFTAAIAAYGQGAFLPILSSPGFNSTNSSQSLGFSVGFFFFLSSVKYDIYLAACGGLSGNYSNITHPPHLSGSDDESFVLLPWTVADGYAVPVWIANLDSPLRSVNSSLVVVEVSGIKELQLRDHKGTVVWNVSNVGMMEMQDTGFLVIYDSTSNVVWNSSSRDTLLFRQNLTVGKELRSNDSQYLARMEKGGLVLYLNAQFIQQPSPYWVIPIFLSNASNLLDLNTLVSSSPCSRPDDDTAYSAVAFLYLWLIAPCITDQIVVPIRMASNFLLTFMKLENDGMLYMYRVSSETIPPSLTQRSALDTYSRLVSVPHSASVPHWVATPDGKASWWGVCDTPMACGPLGVCSPKAVSPCACPQPPLEDSTDFFEAKDNSDSSKGCKRRAPLPNCNSGNEHMINSATDFLQLNHTASIFLFGGWAFNSTISSAPVEECKKSCSANCSCNGFFYQANTSSCFFITDEITFLNVTDQNWTYVDNIDGNVLSQEIFARNYVTYLKVTSAARSGNSSKAASSFVIAITIVSTFVACSVLGLVVYLYSARKSKLRRRSMQESHAKEEQELQDILPLLPTRFSYQDLHEATEAFSKLLGAGGCGTVYAGMLPDGRKIAVKKLETLLKGQSKQFLAEVATIGRTSHHNIVRLVGFCWELLHRLLVYEYVERGSLDHWLFAKGEAKSAAAADGEAAPDLLNWQTRYSIALGIARGLSYLHDECPQPILHFDIKPQNILLDGAFVAKLADFGMSRLMQRDDVSEVITGVRGTPGYIAPEWLSHGVVSKKSDVYSMGMVMLEIVGGRRNLDLALLSNTVDPEEWHFPSWAANKCKQGVMMELVDKRLETFEEDQVQRLIHIAFWCIHENPGMRPYAPTVVKWLEGSSPVKEPPFSTPVHSQCHVQSSS